MSGGRNGAVGHPLGLLRTATTNQLCVDFQIQMSPSPYLFLQLHRLTGVFWVPDPPHGRQIPGINHLGQCCNKKQVLAGWSKSGQFFQSNSVAQFDCLGLSCTPGQVGLSKVV